MEPESIIDDGMGYQKFDCFLFLPSLGNGGTERVSVVLSDCLSSYIRVALVTLGPTQSDFFTVGQSVTRLSVGGLVNTSSAFQALVWNVKKIGRLRKLFKNGQPNTVISFLPQCNVIAIVAAIGTKVNVIVCERNSLKEQNLSYWWRILRKILYRMSSAVIANSLDLTKEVAGETGCKAVYMPNPIVLPKRSNLVKCSEKRILSVGRLVDQKGYDLLLRGFSLSRAKSKGWVLYVVGEGPKLHQLQNLAKELNVDKETVWVGSVTNMEHWYQSSSVFVLSSRHEGTSNAMLEAMAWGKPVVVANTSGGARDVISNGTNGFLVDLVPSQIAEKIDWLIEHPEQATIMGSKARSTAEGFDRNLVSKKWLEMIQNRSC